MAGVTTLNVNDADCLATLHACAELGINHLDTAYVYGPQGESENLIRQALKENRDAFVIATKGGIHFESDQMVTDGRPETLKAECDESLRRLGTDRVELYYLHSPDPEVPMEESAGAIHDLIAAGKVRSAGCSNSSLEQLQAFHAICPLAAVQLPYSMLQRGIERKTLPWCRDQGIAVMVYWALMKGLLAGALPRNHQFAEGDTRQKYPMYQGEEWQRNQDLLDQLRPIAAGIGATVSQLVIAWTIAQPGITAALCGARRPEQIRETGAALTLPLSSETVTAIEKSLEERGPAESNRHFE